MKRKMLITGVAALSVFALIGCQQPVAVTTQPETKTSTATLEILPPTQQTSAASLEILPPTQQTSTSLEILTPRAGGLPGAPGTDAIVEGNTRDAIGVFMKDGKMMTMMNGGLTGEMSADMTMSDGTKVMMTGKVMTNDGSTMMMKEGDAVLMTGEKSTTEAMSGMTNTSGASTTTKTNY